MKKLLLALLFVSINAHAQVYVNGQELVGPGIIAAGSSAKATFTINGMNGITPGLQFENFASGATVINIGNLPDGGIATVDIRVSPPAGVPVMFSGNSFVYSQVSVAPTSYVITDRSAEITSDNSTTHVGKWSEVIYYADGGAGAQFYYGSYSAAQQGDHVLPGGYGQGGFYTGAAGVCENDSLGTMAACSGVLGYAEADNAGTISGAQGVVGETQTGNAASVMNRAIQLRARNLPETGTVVGKVGVGISDPTGAGIINHVALLIDINDPPVVPDGGFAMYSTSTLPSLLNGPITLTNGAGAGNVPAPASDTFQGVDPVGTVATGALFSQKVLNVGETIQSANFVTTLAGTGAGTSQEVLSNIADGGVGVKLASCLMNCTTVANTVTTCSNYDGGVFVPRPVIAGSAITWSGGTACTTDNAGTATATASVP